MSITTTKKTDQTLIPPAVPSSQDKLTEALKAIAAAKRDDDMSAATTREPFREIRSFAESVLKVAHPGCNLTAIDEASQDVLLKVWLAIESYNEDRPAGPWVAVIAYRVGIDRWRQAKRGSSFCAREDRREGGLPFGEVPDHRVSDPASPLVAREEKERLWTAIDDLSPTIKPVVNYRLAGMSNAQIAEILGIPEGTVRTRVHAGVLSLRKALT